MPLYCYIIETGEYEDRESNILGHHDKYSHEEFKTLCIEITEKYGDVEENEYFSIYDKTDVEEILYKIEPEDLIKYLVKDYGFVELDVPINAGYNRKEVSRTPVPPENLKQVKIISNRCPIEKEFSVPADSLPTDHINARCVGPIIKKDQ